MYIEQISSYIGACSETAAQKAELGAIKRFAIASLETNPIYYDEEYAKKTPYGTVIAPPAFTRTFFFPPVLPVEGKMLPIRGRVHGAQEFKFFKPIKAGDTVYCRSKILSAEEKQGKSGFLLFITFEHAALDECGEPYNLAYQTSVYQESLLRSADPMRFTTWYPQIPKDDWLADLPRGDTGSIAVGECVGPVYFPEITRAWIAQWAGATGDFNPIHLDEDKAVQMGQRGCIAHGMISAVVSTRVFSHWLGPLGYLTESDSRFVFPVYPGDHLELTAVIARVRREEGRTGATWEYTVKNAAGRIVLTGSATGYLGG